MAEFGDLQLYEAQAQQTLICSKSKIETLEKDVKYVQTWNPLLHPHPLRPPPHSRAMGELKFLPTRGELSQMGGLNFSHF